MMDNSYMRSALGYLVLQPEISALIGGEHIYQFLNPYVHGSDYMQHMGKLADNWVVNGVHYLFFEGVK